LKIAIHQPNFLPHVGYFRKIAKSDIFVFLDDVQFTKGGYTNRTKLNQDNKYITVPLKHSSFKRICDLQISEPHRFYERLTKTLQQDYKIWYYLLRNTLDHKFEYLSELNISIIELLCYEFNIKTQFVKSSDLYTGDKSKNELLTDIIQSLKCDVYLSNRSSYLDEKLFKRNDIKIEYLDSMEFSNGLSVITNNFDSIKQIIAK